MSELHNKILIKKDIQEIILKGLFAVLIFCYVPGFYLTLKYIEGKFSEKLNWNRVLIDVIREYFVKELYFEEIFFQTLRL